MDPSQQTDRLAELIGQKHDVLTQVCQLSRRQNDVIVRDDMTLLYRIFSAKQTLLEKLNTIEKMIDPFRTQDPEKRRWRSPQERQRVAELARDCETLLEEIKQIDKQDVNHLVNSRDAAAENLDQANRAAAARSAYADATMGRSGNIDLSSEH